MSRKAEPGIFYYSVRCNHIHNKKIRLLINEFDSNGYWIWQCIISEGYSTRGYYFDCEDEEALELFATDVCKKQVSLVKEVIAGCLRRGLFDEAVFKMFGVLTSDHMQEMYLDATAERRRKGTKIELIKEMLLIEIPEESRNISIIPWNNEILPRKNQIIPVNNPQSKVKKSKENIEPNGSVGDAPTDDEKTLKDEYGKITKNKQFIYRFIRDKKPQFIDPYVDFWNLFATERGFAKVSTTTDKRKKKFKKRINEPKFDLIEILRKAKESDLIAAGKWFSFDWILESENNYLKVLEGNYDNTNRNEHSNGFDSTEYKQQRQREEQEAKASY